jgi:hypothetical protein
MRSLLLFFTVFAGLTPTILNCAQLPDLKAKESWTTLSLQGSEFSAVPPWLGQVDSQPTFTRTLVRLQWRNNDPIDTYIVVPKGVAKPPVILYLYMYATNTDRFMRANVCQYLSKGGVAAVGFSTAISGYRFRMRGATEWFVSDLQEALATSTHDVQKMIDYLQTRKDIDTSRIGIYGEGSGAAVAILSASVDPRIKVLDLQDTWGDWPEWLAKSSIIPEAERSKYLKTDFLKGVAGLDPVDYLPKLRIPVRSQYSLKAPVPPEVRKRIEAALPPQAAHTPIETTFDWIKNQLSDMAK